MSDSHVTHLTYDENPDLPICGAPKKTGVLVKINHVLERLGSSIRVTHNYAICDECLESEALWGKVQ